MKKILSLVFVLVLAFSSLTMFTGCGSKENIIRDEKTVNARVFRGGLGDEWVYTLKEKFDAAFAEQGYVLNILTPSSDARAQTVITEMAQGYDETGIDLYITGNATPSQVGVNGDYGLLVEEIGEEVYNQYPIGYDGQNEDVLIKDKTPQEVLKFMKDQGKYYAFNYTDIAAGVVVNTKKLSAYGIKELPRTSNEFLAACEAIYFGANGKGNCGDEGTYPITYVLGTNGYASCAYDCMFAQFGLKDYREFCKLQKLNDDGTFSDVTNPLDYYNNQNIVEVLELAYRFTDPNLAAPDSTTQQLDQAQSKIMKNKNDAVFMFNGQWFLNEVKFNYKNNLDDIDFMNVPVCSAIGKNLFGSASTYKLSDSDADKLLSYIISLIDQNKTVDEIIAAVNTEKHITLAKQDAEKVCEARGVYFARGIEHVAYIAKDTPKKDICALVLRMMASDDFAKDFLALSNVPSPYGKNIEYTSKYKFVNNATAIAKNRYATMITNIWGDEISKIRLNIGVTTMVPRDAYYTKTIADQNISMYDGEGGLVAGKTSAIYRQAAENMYAEMLVTLQDCWDNRKNK